MNFWEGYVCFSFSYALFVLFHVYLRVWLSYERFLKMQYWSIFLLLPPPQDINCILNGIWTKSVAEITYILWWCPFTKKIMVFFPSLSTFHFSLPIFPSPHTQYLPLFWKSEMLVTEFSRRMISQLWI